MRFDSLLGIRATAVVVGLLLAAGWGFGSPVAASSGYEPELWDGKEYRLIGPYRGGRVTAVAGVASEPMTFYMGSTGGGVWKTENAGLSWHNVTDGFLPVGSIGAVSVAPSDPNVIYVGTGSACPRGNVSIGKGLFRSTDAGKSWQAIGLEEAGLIGRIQVHPRDPDLLWVAVLGQIFGPSEERGVYRSRDGGASWERVLEISERTGAVDLALDPHNARVLYAAMWTAERKPWTLIDGSEESGLWRSTDGGDEWTKLEGGLPDGELGRIGVGVSPARPGRVWALVTADEGRGGLFRSDDGGDSWQRVSADRELQTRGWYYSHVHADPHDADTVWVSNAGFFRSIDGGATFERVRTPHGDHHDLWIHPERPGLMVQGNDGGATVTFDGGESWTTQLNQPTAEFYRVTVDNRFPYRVYGAQQDNSTISVPSRPLPGITPKEHWYAVAGAESGHIAVHPDNPDLVYSGNYLGQIDRYDHATGTSRNVILYPQMQDGTAPRDLAYRFQWNAPILISRHDPEVVYHASNFVHRTRDGGVNWETISPDLTRNDSEKQELPGGPVQHDHTGVEVYNTVFVLAESPHDPRELWAGADDGLLHVTRDGGESWQEVTPPGLPIDATVNSIDLSVHEAGKAILAAYRYRSDDWTPYVFRTEDGGRSWTSITGGIPDDWPVRVVREDPDREGLLYAGTEFGLFVSFDDGESWQELQLNLPRTPITDLAVHRQDLVVATQGRSFWVLDDLTLFHQLEPAIAGEPLFLFRPRPVHLGGGGGFRLNNDVGPDAPPRGVTLDLWLAEEPDEETPVVLEILGEEDRIVRRFSTAEPPEWPRRFGRVPTEKLDVEQGLNRIQWTLSEPGPELVEGAIMSLAYTGPTPVPAGSYRVRVTMGELEASQEVEVLIDPRLEGVTAADLEEKHRFTAQVRDRLTGIHDRIYALRSLEQQLETLEIRGREARLEGSAQEGLETSVGEVVEEIQALEEELIQTANEAGQDPINFPPKIDDQYAYLYSHLVQDPTRPTPGSYRRFEDLEAELAPLLERFDRLIAERLPEIERLGQELGLAGVVVPGA